MPTAQRWHRTWERLGAEAPEGVYESLRARYAEPHRAYHTFRHLEECFEQLDRAMESTEPPPEVELALWFHDAVYDTRATDSEERSAAWAREVLSAASLPEAFSQRVQALILATRHDVPASTPEQALVLDVDLSILGAPKRRFDEYERQVRQEYDWVGEADFRGARAAVLQGFLDRPQLYLTPHFKDRLEARARANLERSLRVLRRPEGQD